MILELAALNVPVMATRFIVGVWLILADVKPLPMIKADKHKIKTENYNANHLFRQGSEGRITIKASQLRSKRKTSLLQDGEGSD